MRRKHGDIEYFLVNDQVLLVTSNLRETIRIPISSDFLKIISERGINAEDVVRTAEKLFRFDYMFRGTGLPKYQPDEQDLIKLGLAMTQPAGSESTSSLPAGYTFLGQFIDHDLTFNANEDLSLGGDPTQLKSKRSPSADLDSLYGYEPDKVRASEMGKFIYDGAKLNVGRTTRDDDVNFRSAERSYRHDLPRLPDSKRAALVDSRNDDNLAVAQTHLAFIKFHNAMVDQLSGSTSPDQLFWKAREQVIRHYQRVILEDFLPSLLDEGVIIEIQKEDPKYFRLKPGEEPFMPLEFAVAAFRMGHSLVTARYEWNSIFRSNGPTPVPASLHDLFVFTEGGGLNGTNFLKSSWIIDWTRFFDFTNFQVPINKPSSNAGTIDALIAERLTGLDPIPHHGDHTRSLAVRNLLRGLRVDLPAGQHLAELLDYDKLEPADFVELPYYQTLHKLGFDELTPLWLYILQEAKVRGEGKRLGPVGSRIVAETFVTLIRTSKISILPPGVKWEIPKDKFGMAHLLAFVNDASEKKDFLNPLG